MNPHETLRENLLDRAVSRGESMTVTHETVTHYRYANTETHGHESYSSALAYAQNRLEVNGPGQVIIHINRLEPNANYPGGIRHRWIETLGGIR